jgi:hypothetical protein
LGEHTANYIDVRLHLRRVNIQDKGRLLSDNVVGLLAAGEEANATVTGTAVACDRSLDFGKLFNVGCLLKGRVHQNKVFVFQVDLRGIASQNSLDFVLDFSVAVMAVLLEPVEERRGQLGREDEAEGVGVLSRRKHVRDRGKKLEVIGKKFVFITVTLVNDSCADVVGGEDSGTAVRGLGEALGSLETLGSIGSVVLLPKLWLGKRVMGSARENSDRFVIFVNSSGDDEPHFLFSCEE